MSTRCVVTGHDAEGNAVFASDTKVAAQALTVFDPYAYTMMWSGASIPRFPNDGAPPGCQQFFPPAGGVRFFKMTVPPSSRRTFTQEQISEGFAEMQAIVPGLATHMERRNLGLHTSDTVDFGYVIDGEIWLELDHGEQRQLLAGDAFVQSATRHAWRNKADRPCTMLFVLVGAERTPPGITLVDRPADSTSTGAAGGA